MSDMFDGSTWYLQKGCETRHRLCLGAQCKFLFCTFIFGKNKDDYLVQDNYFMVQHHYRENFSFEIVSSLEV